MKTFCAHAGIPTMRGLTTTFPIGFLLICLFLPNTSWAGQVVTEETRSWAKKVIEQEESIGSKPASNALAVLYFNNKTGDSDLDILRKGLTIVLMTDLSKVKEIQLVERVKVQALMEEMELSVAGIVEAESKPRVGRLLGASHLVGGDILLQTSDRFRLEADLLKVPSETIFGNAKAEGKLIEEFFRMEKELVFDIIRALKIELAPEQQRALKEHFTDSLEALRFFVHAIEHSDRGDFDKARECYTKALQADPNLGLAQQGIQEINATLSSGRGAEGYSKPNRSRKRPSGKSCRRGRNRIMRGLR
jgi:TolB-like protein